MTSAPATDPAPPQIFPPTLREVMLRPRWIALLAFSLIVAGVLAWLVWRAAGADAGSFDAAGYSFLAALMALAILEHWFLVLPLPTAALWSWGLRSRTPRVELATPRVELARRAGETAA